MAQLLSTAHAFSKVDRQVFPMNNQNLCWGCSLDAFVRLIGSKNMPTTSLFLIAVSALRQLLRTVFFYYFVFWTIGVPRTGPQCHVPDKSVWWWCDICAIKWIEHGCQHTWPEHKRAQPEWKCYWLSLRGTARQCLVRVCKEEMIVFFWALQRRVNRFWAVQKAGSHFCLASDMGFTCNRVYRTCAFSFICDVWWTCRWQGMSPMHVHVQKTIPWLPCPMITIIVYRRWPLAEVFVFDRPFETCSHERVLVGWRVENDSGISAPM